MDLVDGTPQGSDQRATAAKRADLQLHRIASASGKMGFDFLCQLWAYAYAATHHDDFRIDDTFYRQDCRGDDPSKLMDGQPRRLVFAKSFKYLTHSRPDGAAQCDISIRNCGAANGRLQSPQPMSARVIGITA